ncbi:HEAT repeat domain-containing protein [Paenibacillus agricola]|uniref:HEAT repeat domain-containing protein n=1 Tax=Paenibacillus agricola TaxID=2716264 RepID=A0ABX0J9Q2_9BACL|nr:HEAT repeat domain-containing protein [Paenibacillus agricola]NHN31939.1 HEAT repeat domain-containing protein [Paenibacillus agricola]
MLLPDSIKPILMITALLLALIIGGLAVLFILRAKSRSSEHHTAYYLHKHKDYFLYLSIHIDNPEPLLPPPGLIKTRELVAIQQKLLEWIEMFEGSHRDKLSQLCYDMGLVERERQRLHSLRHWERIDAAYHLGVMRAKDCFGELLRLLEHETDDSTAFVIGRAAAKCTQQPGELRKLVLRLAKHHPQSHHLILDIVGSSSLNPLPLYLDLLQVEDVDLITLALIGLSGYNEHDAIPFLDLLVQSEHKEVRIKAAKLLLEYTHLLQTEPLMVFMSHSDWEIRAAAMKVAGEQPSGDFIPILKDALTDPDWWVRHNSAQSLGKLGLPGFQALCVAHMAAPNTLDLNIASEAVHEQLEIASELASQDITQRIYFNELSHMYEKICNVSYVNQPHQLLRIRS